MTFGQLVRRNICFHWRMHACALAGVAVSTAIIVGALAVGDAVRLSLRQQALNRVGSVQSAMHGRDRFVREELGSQLQTGSKVSVHTLINLPGVISVPRTRHRVNNVQILGVNKAFWQAAPRPGLDASLPEDGILLNDLLATSLDVKTGDEILLRLERPDILSRDAPLSSTENTSLAFRLKVAAVLSVEQFGRFDLQANPLGPRNAFVPLSWLQEQLDLVDRCNLLLAGGSGEQADPTNELQNGLAANLRLSDADTELRFLEDKKQVELRSRRIFLDDPIVQAVQQATDKSEILFSYFVNGLIHGGRVTPYSIVSTVSNSSLGPGEILVSQWLADDLQIGPGDSLTMTYYIMGTQRRLVEKQRDFQVKSIYPMDSALVDLQMMPPFPGIADQENCRDWEPGIPIDLDKIRDTDEAYWDDYRGTPKALVSLIAARDMWSNRFGSATAVRFNATQADSPALESRIMKKVSPESLGLVFRSVRTQALTASSSGMDFGGLFLGFSFFLIIAALVLVALLYTLQTRHRSTEIGTLSALGFSAGKIRWLFCLEGALVAVPGVMAGCGLGLGYTRLLIYGLRTFWAQAVGQSQLQFTFRIDTVLYSGLGSWLIVLITLALVLWRQLRRPTRELLSAGAAEETPAPARSRRWDLWIGIVALLSAVAMAATAGRPDDPKAAETFFGSGALVLLGGLLLARALLGRLAQSVSFSRLSLRGLGLRNVTRRKGRSLTVILMLACGSFIVLSLEAWRLDNSQAQPERKSGTGGFALYGEAAIPVYDDLNSPRGRELFGLESEQMQQVQFVACRRLAGDDASCLNLNRAQRPTILSVDPTELDQRGAFRFAGLAEDADADKPWLALNQSLLNEEIPVVMDQNSALYALGLKLGDTLTYPDEQGRPQTLRLVGFLANSMMQGVVIMAERNFLEMFPNSSGYEVFLIDAPFDQLDQVQDRLSFALADNGLEFMPASQRLALYNAVQNTYLSIFQVLGGLGLLLGSVGLAVVVLRNTLERQSELAMLQAVGFTRCLLRRMLLLEHGGLLALGLICGLAAALLAIVPAWFARNGQLPVGGICLLIGLLLGVGVLWIALAADRALRRSALDVLRNE